MQQSAKKDSAASDESKSVAGSWRQESVTGMRGKCDDRQIDSARGKGDVGQVVGVRKYGKIAALAMATRGKINDGQTATLAMAMHDKGNDGQIAGARGNRDVG